MTTSRACSINRLDENPNPPDRPTAHARRRSRLSGKDPYRAAHPGRTKDDSVGQVVVASGGVNVPSIDTREISTQVLVNDGQTVVLGGILSTTQREDDTKVPYLGDIPVLGHLFKSTSHKDNKDELMIFITPKIVREGVNVYN